MNTIDIGLGLVPPRAPGRLRIPDDTLPLPTEELRKGANSLP